MDDVDRAAYAAQLAQDAVDDALERVRNIRSSRRRTLMLAPAAGVAGACGVLLSSWWAIPAIVLFVSAVVFLFATEEDARKARIKLRNAERHQRDLAMGWREP